MRYVALGNAVFLQRSFRPWRGISMSIIFTQPRFIQPRSPQHRHVLSASLLLILLLCKDIGCTNDLLNPGVQIPTGQYAGQYSLTRTASGDTSAGGARFETSEASLIINADLKTYRFAPIGDSTSLVSSQGVYTLAHTQITFTDRSMRNFPDPSLVMNGECVYTFDGTNLVITKTDAQTKREKQLFLVRKF
jgi:hypothetical protein